MKIRLYLDVYSTDGPNSNYFAVSHPSMKTEGTKRYAIDVTVPDPRDDGVDAHIPPDKVRLTTDGGAALEADRD